MGLLTQGSLIEAMVDPVIVEHSNYLYTFTDVRIEKLEKEQIVYGQLSKYSAEGRVEVVEPEKHASVPRLVPNILQASSGFIYFPDISALAYQHVWNQLELRTFQIVFQKLVRKKHGDFFVDCLLEAISDLRTFIFRVSKLSAIRSIDATVHPPNPLFGPAWESLREHMRRRKAEEVRVRERAADESGLASALPAVAKAVADRKPLDAEAIEASTGNATLEIADAAVLMAADGYGKARVDGVDGAKRTVVSTRENQIAIEVSKETGEIDIARIIRERLDRAAEESGLRH